MRATLRRVILHNGSVRTGDPRLPLARALAIAGDRIGGGVDVREGDRSRVSNERIDLGGRCVVPGFTDAHVHFLEWSLVARPARPLARRARRPRCWRAAAARRAERDGWLIGAGWRSDALARRRPGTAPRGARRRLRRPPGRCSGRTTTTPPGCPRRRSRCCRSATRRSSSATPRASPPGVLRETAAWDAAAADPAAARARARRGASRAACARRTRAA